MLVSIIKQGRISKHDS